MKSGLRDLEVTGLEDDNFINLSKAFTQMGILVKNKPLHLRMDIDKWPFLQEVKLPYTEVWLLICNNVHEAFEPWKVIHSQNHGPYAAIKIFQLGC